MKIALNLSNSKNFKAECLFALDVNFNEYPTRFPGTTSGGWFVIDEKDLNLLRLSCTYTFKKMLGQQFFNCSGYIDSYIVYEELQSN